jgi:hypothetical protein
VKKITIVGTVPRTVDEKIASVEEARRDAVEAEKDFRRCGMTTYAHDAALFIVKCDEQIADLNAQFADEVIAATEPSLRGFGS